MAVLLTAWRLGCGAEHDHGARLNERGAPAQAAASLVPEWGRCVEVRGTSTPTCIFDPERPLRLWIDHEGASQAEIFVDGESQQAERYEAPEMVGTGLRLFLPPSARELRVQVAGAEPWTLALQSTQVPDLLADEASAVDELMGRVNQIYREGQDWTVAKALAEQAVQRALDVGLTSKALDAALMSVFYLGWHVERPDLARQTLSEIHEVAMRSPQGSADWDASSGHVSWGQGDVAEAARAYREASRHAVRMEDERLIVEAMPMYATALAELGYFRAAAYWSQHALAFVEPGSESHGQVLETAGWVNLVLRRDGHEHTDPIPLYEQAMRIFGPEGSFPAPERIGAAILGLAEAHLLEGELEAALLLLEKVIDERLTLDDRAYRHDLELRIRLRRGDDETTLQSSLSHLERAAKRAASPEAHWWFETRRGDVLARTGQREAAVVAYQTAEERLDEIAQLAAFGVGRWALGESRRTSSVRLAETLLDLDRPDDALCALREAEARRARLAPRARLDPELHEKIAAYVRKKSDLDELVASSNYATVSERMAIEDREARALEELRTTINGVLLQAGRRWGRPRCAELGPRRPGELLLGLYPTGGEWLMLAQDDLATTAFRMSEPAIPASAAEREQLSQSILTPIDAQLSRAEQLRVLASGKASAIDIQALPWHGRPLLGSITVVYGAELPPGPSRRWPDHPRALLIADPTHTLAEAEREIVAIARALQGAGYLVEVLPRESARVPMTGPAIERANLMHFSGHSRYPGIEEHGLWPPYAGGTPGTPSHLVLADGRQLAVHDVLLLAAVPEVVVLEGCEAGALDPGAGGMTLARAFVASGSRVVVASPDPLQDELAAMLGEALYGGLESPRPFDAAEALRLAQSGLWDVVSDPETNIGRYRAWVP